MNRKLILCAFALSGLMGTLGYSAEEQNQGNVMTNNEMIKLPSGLSYQILKAAPANAKSPKKGDMVVVQYTGWLNDNGKEGKKFDSSLDRNTPFSFKIGVGQVIPGWDTGVMQMKVGEKIRLYIPANLGYGARGAGNVIPPNSDLIFDVELLEVK